jgi:hypothetical protein
MVARVRRIRELCTSFLWATAVLSTVLLVVVPAHSLQGTPTSRSFELSEEPQSYASPGVLACLVLGFLLLLLLAFSYLRTRLELQARMRPPVQHWWQHVHMHVHHR